MRGAFLALIFFSVLPLVFVSGPFVGVLVYFWASLMGPQFLVWGFAASIPYAFIAAGSTVLSWVVLSSEPKLPPLDKLTVLIVLLMIWISLTSWFGSASPELMNFYWSNSEKMLFMTLVAYAMLTNRKRINQLVAVCAVSVAYYGFKGGVWAVMHGGQDRVWGPDGSMIGDNNLLGAAVVTILPLLVYVRQCYFSSKLKVMMLVVIGFTALGAIFTYSRGTFLALIVMTGSAWLLARQKVALTIVALGIAVGVWEYAPPQWFARMGTIETYDKDASAEERLYLWQLSWALALKHPLLGGGAGWSYNVSFVNQEFAGTTFHWPFGGRSEINDDFAGGVLPPLIRPRAAHSIWFQVLSDQGFPGLLLFIGVLVIGTIDAQWLIRSSRGRQNFASIGHLGRALQSSLVAYIIAGTFASLAMYDLPYVIVALAAASRRLVAMEMASEAKLARRGIHSSRGLNNGRHIGPGPAAASGAPVL